MKKYLIIGVLLSSFLLGSCSSVNSRKITELEKQVQELKKDKENDLFKKKQECAKYKDEILKYLENESGGGFEYSFLELFYSKKRNSCIYLTYERDTVNLKSFKQIRDVLTSEIIFEIESYCKNISDMNCTDAIKAYNEKLKELKGE